MLLICFTDNGKSRVRIAIVRSAMAIHYGSPSPWKNISTSPRTLVMGEKRLSKNSTKWLSPLDRNRTARYNFSERMLSALDELVTVSRKREPETVASHPPSASLWC